MLGKSNNLDIKNAHKSMNGDCPAFHNAVKKYVIDGFDFIVLGEFEQENDAFSAEKV